MNKNCSWQYHNFQDWLLLTNIENAENHRTEKICLAKDINIQLIHSMASSLLHQLPLNIFLHGKLPHLLSEPWSMQGTQRHFQCTQKMGWFWMTLTLTLQPWQPVGVTSQQRRCLWTEPLLCLSSLWKVVMLHSGSSGVRIGKDEDSELMISNSNFPFLCVLGLSVLLLCILLALLGYHKLLAKVRRQVNEIPQKKMVSGNICTVAQVRRSLG